MSHLPQPVRTFSFKRLLLALGVLTLSLIGATNAQAAGELTNQAPSCDGRTLEQPFQRWLDPIDYTLVPDGDLTAGGAGWQLSGGAEVVAQNEPWYVHGGTTAAALRLPQGASATTPAVCVAPLDVVARFFARSTGSALGTLRAEVLYEDAAGNVHALPIGVVSGLLAANWTPSLPMPVLADLLEVLPGGNSAVAFRFTAVGPGSTWLVDDVYVDPYRKG
jgi:hypothetical protein